MKNKKLKILFLYPNINMRTLVPNAISILAAVLKKSGFKIIEKPLISTSDLLRYINKINVIVVRSRTKITRDIIEKSNTLELIARPGTGVDNIDLIAAKDNDIPVFTSVIGAHTFIEISCNSRICWINCF